MNCREITHDVLLDAAAGAGPPEVRAHVEACPHCRAELEAVRTLAQDLERLGRALREPPGSGALGRLLSRLETAPPPRKVRPRRPFWPWVAAGATAAAAAAAVLWLRPEPVPRHEAPVAAAPQAPPAVPPPDPEPAPAPEPEPPAPPAAARPPQPVPAPTPRPEPRAPERPPEPAPEPPPEPAAPAAPPGPTRPARVFLAIARLEGPVEAREGKSWKKIQTLAEWDEGGSLRAGDRPARIVLADGARLTLRPRAEVRAAAASPPEIFLEAGEVFCDVPPAPGRRFAVRTRDALVRVTGTQFAVKEGDAATEVVVAAGEVAVSNDRGEARVPAGTGLAVRRSAPPGRPRPVDADRVLAWRKAADPPETVLVHFGFEDGRRPAGFDGGRVVPGPPRGLNRFCLEGSPELHFDLRRALPGAAARPGLRVRFRYHAEKGGSLWVQLFNDRVGDNFRYDVPHVAAGTWETVEAPLERFYRLADRSSALLPGDPLTWFNIAAAGGGTFHFDDVEIVEVRP